MKFAIIAAGEGSRLAQEGVKQPKPLVPLHGTPLIECLIKIFNSHIRNIPVTFNPVFVCIGVIKEVVFV